MYGVGDVQPSAETVWVVVPPDQVYPGSSPHPLHIKLSLQTLESLLLMEFPVGHVLTHDALEVLLFCTVYPLLQVTLFIVPPPQLAYAAQDADVLVFPVPFVQAVLRDSVASV